VKEGKGACVYEGRILFLMTRGKEMFQCSGGGMSEFSKLPCRCVCNSIYQNGVYTLFESSCSDILFSMIYAYLSLYFLGLLLLKKLELVVGFTLKQVSEKIIRVAISGIRKEDPFQVQ
jgi:hypothetical protein